MVTYKLEDDGPTTTITFDAFTVVEAQLITQDMVIFAYPENEGVEVVYLGQSYMHFTFSFEFKDDATDTAYEKYEEFRQLLKEGGDNEWLFTVTFDKPDGSGTEVWTGKVRNLTAKFEGGEHEALVEGDFEFIEDTISGT